MTGSFIKFYQDPQWGDNLGGSCNREEILFDTHDTYPKRQQYGTSPWVTNLLFWIKALQDDQKGLYYII